MNKKQITFLLHVLFLCTITNADITKHHDVRILTEQMKDTEKRAYFSCLNPVKSRHLATKYTLFKLKIENQSGVEYSLDAHNCGLTLMSPERLAERVQINRSWVPVALGATSAIVLSSIFYIAFVPAIAISFTLGACAATINPHKVSRKNSHKMLGYILDDKHETIIPSYGTLKKVIAVRTKKNRGKVGVFTLKNHKTQNVVEFKIKI